MALIIWKPQVGGSAHMRTKMTIDTTRRECDNLLLPLPVKKFQLICLNKFWHQRYLLSLEMMNGLSIVHLFHEPDVIICAILTASIYGRATKMGKS